MDRPYRQAIEFIYDRHSWVSPRIRSGARYHATGGRRRGSRGPLCRRRDLVVEFRRQRAARGRADRAAGRPGDRRNGGCTRRSGAPARHRDGPGLQHGDRQEPGRRPDRQGRFRRRPGGQRGRPAVSDRSATLSDCTRPGAGDKAEGRGATRRRQARSRALFKAARHRLSDPPELRPADGAGRPAAGRDQGRSSGGRQRPAQSRLRRHPLADRRPARSPARRQGQPRPYGRQHGAGHDHSAEADLRQLHIAAGHARRGSRAAAKGAACGTGLRQRRRQIAVAKAS